MSEPHAGREQSSQDSAPGKVYTLTACANCGRGHPIRAMYDVLIEGKVVYLCWVCFEEYQHEEERR